MQFVVDDLRSFFAWVTRGITSARTGAMRLLLAVLLACVPWVKAEAVAVLDWWPRPQWFRWFLISMVKIVSPFW